MIAPQQRIQSLQAQRQFLAVQRDSGQRLPELVEIPCAAFDTAQQLVELLPLHNAVEPAIQARMECRCIYVFRYSHSHPALLTQSFASISLRLVVQLAQPASNTLKFFIATLPPECELYQVYSGTKTPVQLSMIDQDFHGRDNLEA